MKIKFGKYCLHSSSIGAFLIFALIFWYIFAGLLIGFLKAPRSIIYFGDFINICLLLKALLKYKNHKLSFKKSLPLLFMVIFTLIGVLSAFINLESPIQLAWGIRQNCRYFVFYFACLMYLKKVDVDNLLKLVGILFWISLPLCIYEAFFVSYGPGDIVGDYVGGVFYGIQGVNAPLNVILIIYTSITVIKFFVGERKIVFLLMTLGVAVGMAAMAELKVFMIEVIFIFIFAMVRNGVSVKSIFLIILGIIAFSYVGEIYVQINARGRSYYTTDYLSIAGMIENITRAEGYDGVGDLNRLTAIPTLFNRFFKGDIWSTLFGIGLGNADYSLGITALQSDFYQQYSGLHYQWFSTAFVFVETGVLGLINYLLIFITALIQGIKRLNKKSFYSIFHYTMMIQILLLIVYNQTLRSEQCAFILYLILAISAIDFNENNYINKGEAYDS